MVESLLGVKNLMIESLGIYILIFIRIEPNRSTLVESAEIRVKVLWLAESLVLDCESSEVGRVEVKACKPY